MPDNPDAKKEENSQSFKDIQIPSIPKQTAGAVAGAAVGSVAGPIGAVVGGVVGAIAGKAAEKQRPIASATRRAARNVVKSSKSDLENTPQTTSEQKIRCQIAQRSCALPRQGEKKSIASIERLQNHTKRRELGDGPHHPGLLGNALAIAANGVSRLTTKSG
jgi:hypothetical protein